jgi:gas vesicle protein
MGRVRPITDHTVQVYENLGTRFFDSNQWRVTLEAAAWGFVGTLIGAVVGAATSVLTTNINSRNAYNIHSLKNDQERTERARVFQREALLTTQDIVQEMMRLMARAHQVDNAAFRESQQWGRNMLEDGLSESIRIANQKMTAMVERISDDSLRASLKSLHSLCNNVLAAESPEESRELFNVVSEYFTEVMAQLGIALRSHY